jgi:hypothetical protein
MMVVSAVGDLSVNCLQMGLDRHMCRGISINQSEICLQFAFDAFKLGSALLPDAIMVLIIIAPANMPDTSPLLLFGYHMGKVTPQAIGHESAWRDSPDGTLKRAAALVQLIGRQRVNRMLYRCHVPSLDSRGAGDLHGR